MFNIINYQAAEAYANKNKASNVNNNHRTWSASSSSRARSRPGLSSDLFQTPQKSSRTASASPGLHRKRLNSGSDKREERTVSSTHSTPSRRPHMRRQDSKVTRSHCKLSHSQLCRRRVWTGPATRTRRSSRGWRRSCSHTSARWRTSWPLRESNYQR